MAEDWCFYFRDIKGKPASIFLDIERRKKAPDRKRPWLCCVRLRMNAPREDGLSSSAEWKELGRLEDALSEHLRRKLKAVFAGRVTGDGQRHFYYYTPKKADFESATSQALSPWPDYRFECGTTFDPEWNAFQEVLCPSAEEMETIKNLKVLDALEEHGDDLETPREVSHWVYFETPEDRRRFNREAKALGYEVKFESDLEEGSKVNRFCTCLTREDKVEYASINELVIELFRLAAHCNGDYDGWETEVCSSRAN